MNPDNTGRKISIERFKGFIGFDKALHLKKKKKKQKKMRKK